MSEKKALFVNLQSGAVTVSDDKRRSKSVQPWANRSRKSVGGTYIVAGEHYRRFVSKMGPLYPLPAGELFDPSLLPPDVDAPEVETVEPPAPPAPEADKSEDPATGQTEGFQDGTAGEGSDEVESGGGDEDGADAGNEDAPSPSSGKVKVRGRGKR